MGTLLLLPEARLRCLRPLTTLGRDPDSVVVLPRGDRRVSRLHASLTWIGARWWLKDLGSKRGTFVDGRRVPAPGPGVPLLEGAQIGLGSPEPMLVLKSAVGPRPFVRHTPTGQEQEETEGGGFPLPGGTLVQDLELGWLWPGPTGAPGPWPGEVQGWTLVDAEALQSETMDDARVLSQATLIFVLGGDAAPRLRLVWPNLEVDLGRRQPWWTLLELARARLEGSGWLSKRRLAKQAMVTEHTLDMHLARARRLLSDRGVVGVEELLDVADNQRRLRLPAEQLRIEPDEGADGG